VKIFWSLFYILVNFHLGNFLSAGVRKNFFADASSLNLLMWILSKLAILYKHIQVIIQVSIMCDLIVQRPNRLFPSDDCMIYPNGRSRSHMC